MTNVDAPDIDHLKEAVEAALEKAGRNPTREGEELQFHAFTGVVPELAGENGPVPSADTEREFKLVSRKVANIGGQPEFGWCYDGMVDMSDSRPEELSDPLLRSNLFGKLQPHCRDVRVTGIAGGIVSIAAVFRVQKS